ncbi:protein ACCELERATED CELL DEATH 6-like [Olea europaea var. sylvestris]|nr:protein ACCELERATED CELL DEATH 6-like [Olea europaea var. sylvestris]
MVNLMTKEDPEIANIANNALETPLFLAVDIVRGDENQIMSVNYILENCPSPAYTGPNRKTALHAAALYNQKQISRKLLKKHPNIITEVDDRGWSALHYAAQRGFGFDVVAAELLKADKSIAYIVAKNDNNKTALHISTCQGKVEIMEEILAYCPDCWVMVTGDGQNILHLSVKFEQKRAFKFIMEKPWVGNLLNQKDEEGNTPLHLYAATYDFNGRDLVNHPQAEKNSVNKEFMTPLDVIEFSDFRSMRKFAVAKELKAKGAERDAWNLATRLNSQRSQIIKDNIETLRKIATIDIRKVADTHIVVAALITTVAFAAGFTIPGGYDGNDGPNKGLAILSRKAAFKAFIITDTLAMVCSASAIFLHFFAAVETDDSKLRKLWGVATMLVMVAMGAMVIAFMTGLYTVLQHSLELAITECAICIFCFPVIYYSVKMTIPS